MLHVPVVRGGLLRRGTEMADTEPLLLNRAATSVLDPGASLYLAGGARGVPDSWTRCGTTPVGRSIILSDIASNAWTRGPAPGSRRWRSEVRKKTMSSKSPLSQNPGLLGSIGLPCTSGVRTINTDARTPARNFMPGDDTPQWSF